MRVDRTFGRANRKACRPSQRLEARLTSAIKRHCWRQPVTRSRAHSSAGETSLSLPFAGRRGRRRRRHMVAKLDRAGQLDQSRRLERTFADAPPANNTKPVEKRVGMLANNIPLVGPNLLTMKIKMIGSLCSCATLSFACSPTRFAFLIGGEEAGKNHQVAGDVVDVVVVVVALRAQQRDVISSLFAVGSLPASKQAAAANADGRR